MPLFFVLPKNFNLSVAKRTLVAFVKALGIIDFVHSEEVCFEVPFTKRGVAAQVADKRGIFITLELDVPCQISLQCVTASADLTLEEP